MPNLFHNFAYQSDSSSDGENFWSRWRKKKEKVEADNFRKEKEKVASYAKIVKKEKDERNRVKQQIDAKELEKNKKNLSEKIGAKFKTVANGWQASGILKTNLVENEVTTVINWKKNIIILSSVLGVVVLIIVVLYGGLIFWERSALQKEEALDAEITELKKAIAETKIKMKEVDAFRERLQLAGNLLDKHIYWTNFFSFLEKNILPDVYLTADFSGTPEGEYSFSALTTNFSRLADQIRFLRANKNVISVSVDGGKLVSDGSGSVSGTGMVDMIEFILNLKIKPEVFYK